MTEEVTPVDSGETKGSADAASPDGQSQESASGNLIPKTEADKAFIARDKARAELRERENELKALAAKVGELEAQYSEATGLVSKLSGDIRKRDIHTGVMSQIPDPSKHGEVALMMKGLLAEMSDDKSAEEVVAEVLEGLKATAPSVLEATQTPGNGARKTGVVPPDTTGPMTVEAALARSRAETEKDVRKRIPGFRSVL